LVWVLVLGLRLRLRRLARWGKEEGGHGRPGGWGLRGREFWDGQGMKSWDSAMMGREGVENLLVDVDSGMGMQRTGRRDLGAGTLGAFCDG